MKECVQTVTVLTSLNMTQKDKGTSRHFDYITTKPTHVVMT